MMQVWIFDIYISYVRLWWAIRRYFWNFDSDGWLTPKFVHSLIVVHWSYSTFPFSPISWNTSIKRNFSSLIHKKGPDKWILHLPVFKMNWFSNDNFFNRLTIFDVFQSSAVIILLLFQISHFWLIETSLFWLLSSFHRLLINSDCILFIWH